LLETVASRVKLWRCARVGAGVRVLGRVWVHGGGVIELGAGVVLDARSAPIELRAAPTAVLTLGAGCSVLGGASLEAEGRVTIGDRVRVGAFAKVLDTHFHSLTGDRHMRPPPGIVVIEDGVVLEAYSIVLPGAHLERDCVVAERAVIGKRVPSGMRAVGNPARIERSAQG
jgi:acetyltransferase-like isoleucine patch superfamily enzyme